MRTISTYLISFCFIFAPIYSSCQGIVGGEDVQEGTYPFMVGVIESQNISLYQGFECGATLVGPTWVMTAAHCVEGMKGYDLDVLLGTVDLHKPSSAAKRVRVKKIHIHPDYRKVEFNYRGISSNLPADDIALLELETPFYGEYISLPEENDDAYNIHGLPCRVTGWGRADKDPRKEVATKLQETQIWVVDRQVCQSYIPYNQVVDDHMLCAGLLEEGAPRGGARGDSGGPLMIEIDGGWKQIGIMSWGFGITEFERPAVYQKVSSHLEWLHDVMGTLTSSPELSLGDIIVETHPNQFVMQLPEEWIQGTYQIYSLDGGLKVPSTRWTAGQPIHLQRHNQALIWCFTHQSGVYTQVLR